MGTVHQIHKFHEESSIVSNFGNVKNLLKEDNLYYTKNIDKRYDCIVTATRQRLEEQVQ